MATFTLYGIVQGDTTVFDVTVSADECVSGLKKLIHQEGKKGILHDTDAKDLSLWVPEPIRIAPINTLFERVASLGTELSRFAFEMAEPACEVSHYLPQDLLKGHLYIIVRALNPDMLKSARSPSHVSMKRSHPDLIPPDMEQYIPREETVRGLYNKLKEDKYIQVRGAPGSGKTTLAKLLHKYIMDNEPNSWVTRVLAWPPEGTMPPGGWRKWLSLRWNFQPDSVLIVDEAQSSYWDNTFWLELIQAIKPDSQFRVITFASYGSAGRSIYDPKTRIHISPRQNISLFALDHGDGIAVGLFLTKFEFEELVAKLFVGHYFDLPVLDSVFDITSGHVGACKDFLNIVRAHESYQSLKFTGKLYTIDDFMTSFHMTELLEALSSSPSFSRGLPKTGDLQDTSLVQVLRDVLLTGSIVVDNSFDELSTAAVKSPLRRCFELGWLHNEVITPTQVAYTFPSPLHKRYVQCMILGTFPANGNGSSLLRT